ncbi:flagellar FlbD family protein [Clostridium sp. Marseille-QA1073]
MIKVTTLNKKEIVLNCDHIEKMEAVPETIITLTNGKVYLLANTIDEVMEKVIQYKNKIYNSKF